MGQRFETMARVSDSTCSISSPLSLWVKWVALEPRERREIGHGNWLSVRLWRSLPIQRSIPLYHAWNRTSSNPMVLLPWLRSVVAALAMMDAGVPIKSPCCWHCDGTDPGRG